MTAASRPTTARACLRLALPLLLAGCQTEPPPALPPLSEASGNVAASVRRNGSVGSPHALPPPELAYGSTAPTPVTPGRTTVPSGNFSLDFADTDIREVVAQMLGTMLGQNYTIDPAVHGNVTLHTGRPVPGSQVLSTLQTLLGSTGAVLVQSDGLWRVVPAANAAAAGSRVVALRYASAEDLLKVLQPLVGNNAHLVAETGLNALVVTGDPGQVDALTDLITSFDVDALSGQSYAVLPVESGSAKDFADAMQQAFKGRGGASLAGLVRVVPLERLNAVLVVTAQPRYLDAARKVYGLVERERQRTVRGWQVRYLQNGSANDVAYTLQMAFTPNNVTAQPEGTGQNSARIAHQNLGGTSFGGISGQGGGGGISGQGAGTMGGGITGGAGGGGFGGIGGGGIGGGGTSSLGGANPLAPGGAPPGGAGAAPAGNPLLGGLQGGGGGGGGGEEADSMRILPDPQNNAILIYGTQRETDTVMAMLNKVDILPMQVRIDAVIAEVTLNDQLQYGTQFFFKAGGVNGILNNGINQATGAVGNPTATVLSTTFPGFLIGGNGQGGAPFVITALQAVTKVNILSSPQLTVVDNQVARLQVGQLVPYLTGSAQSTLVSGAPIVNSVSYQPTGVIMEVTPRVNSGGLVTLDITQEVSDVSPTVSTVGISSPTFNERNVTSRVVVQDGQTAGLAGLIQDSISRGNSGIPWLKDIPLLGALAGTQNNTRARTELLVLLTPHVIRDQNAVRAATADMRDALRNAAAVPTISANEPASGSDDPNRRIREKVRHDLQNWFNK